MLSVVLFLISCEDKNISSNKIVKKQAYKEEIINGYKLPPQPDPVINNSTLLGIDSNNNGVRDDVERALLFKYNTKKDRIKLAVAMQTAKAYQVVIKNPSNGLNTKHILNAATYCDIYYIYVAKDIGDPYAYLESESPDKFLESIQFNTEERIRANFHYNESLSGKVYSLPEDGTYKSYCDFNASEIMEEKSE